MGKQDIGVVGLGLMGKNLALNIESRGYSVALYNRSAEKTGEFLQESGVEKQFHGTYSLDEFIRSLARPRKILLIVKAGTATDEMIQSLLPHLERGDIVIDGGNSYFKETIKRHNELSKLGIHYMDISFSGGEKGALYGPAIMPAGSEEAFQLVKPILTAISAKVDGAPCFAYLGSSGAGHYVKMVHNGIEYSDMQLISESYFLLKQVLGLNAEELHQVFIEWNNGELNSYLIEITGDIFTKVDAETGKPLIEVILDTAAQKGTGKWASQNALDLGVPLSVITESVFARIISSMKEERVNASKVLMGPQKKLSISDREEFIETIRKALYMSKLCAYAQGFAQMRAASEEFGWKLPYGEIAMTFRGGCIIRAQFLTEIKDAFDQDYNLANLLLAPYFNDVVQTYQTSLRRTVITAIEAGIPVPALSSSLTYYDSYRSETLPANLLQAQRDYFGAHTYKRTDKEGSFHTEWSE
ncbi:NADP-dependent phosphogluconate dehydrogenase [Anaerobacillus sp. MEB173]|uniref:NADP-dependent phosphogluconate dehydrogenase n=1 Tax=Anaerobacillus sp. MEB173 TaxID=3383345 RepID=UPI003F936A28